MEVKRISIIGLGKLDLCIAACLADKGYNVIGMDIDNHKIDQINKGLNPVEETGLTELIKKCKANFKVTNDYSDAQRTNDCV